MSSIPYNLNIPAAANNPSVDQPNLLTNTNAVSTIVAVDHYTFADSNSGTHKQITFPNQNAPGTLSGNTATIYTAAGLANSAASQLYWKNSQGGASATPYQLGAIKAWAICDSTGTITGSQSLNVSSITPVSTGKYSVSLASNAVSNANYAVLITCSDAAGSRCVWSYTNQGSSGFIINVASAASGFPNIAPQSISFVVLQI